MIYPPYHFSNIYENASMWDKFTFVEMTVPIQRLDRYAQQLVTTAYNDP